MKWVEFFFSTFMSNGKIDPFDKVKNIFIKNAPKMTFFIFGILVLAIVFSSGLIITTLSLLTSTSAGTYGGLGLMVSSLIILFAVIYYLTLSLSLPKGKKEQTTQLTLLGPNLENALVLLITEYIEDKKNAPPSNHSKNDQEVEAYQTNKNIQIH